MEQATIKLQAHYLGLASKADGYWTIMFDEFPLCGVTEPTLELACDAAQDALAAACERELSIGKRVPLPTSAELLLNLPMYTRKQGIFFHVPMAAREAKPDA